MSEFYVVEFPNEDNEKSRGPFMLSEDKVESTDHANEVQVRWEAIDGKGDIIDSYYAGVCLFKGTRKACADFKEKLRKNRETVEISNKESRSRKKSAKLLESDDSELFVLNDSWNLSGPPKKKQKTSLKSQGKENNTELNGKIVCFITVICFKVMFQYLSLFIFFNTEINYFWQLGNFARQNFIH